MNTGPASALQATFPSSIGHWSRSKHFYDTEERDGQRGVRQLTGEERVWATTLIDAIQTIKGVVKDANEECVECHMDQHPECFKKRVRGNQTFMVRSSVGCSHSHTYAECENAWLFDDQAHEKGSFLWICDNLGLEPDYLRNNLNRETFEEYWKDDAKIRVFLGFESSHERCPAPDTHDDPRHTGSAGSTD